MQSFIHENNNEVFSIQSIINTLVHVYRQDITIPHLNRLYLISSSVDREL